MSLRDLIVNENLIFGKYDQQIEGQRKIFGMAITNGGCNCEKKGSYADPI